MSTTPSNSIPRPRDASVVISLTRFRRVRRFGFPPLRVSAGASLLETRSQHFGIAQ